MPGYVIQAGKSKRFRIPICDCCVEGLEKQIRENFCKNENIGVTFIGDQVAFIFVGRFVDVKNAVLIVKDIFVPDTTSFLPLCDIASVEKGIDAAQANPNPICISLNEE
ncbi:MAG: hypothetical protein MJA84_00575 [Firmicutes bacterium]|nr:hypothetical protein [Bacillota bacterium]